MSTRGRNVQFRKMVEHVAQKRVNRSRVGIALLTTRSTWFRTTEMRAQNYPTQSFINGALFMAIEPWSRSTPISSTSPLHPTSPIAAASKPSLCAVVFAKDSPSRFDRYLFLFNTVLYLRFINIIRSSDIGTKCCAWKSCGGKHMERKAFRKRIRGIRFCRNKPSPSVLRTFSTVGPGWAVGRIKSLRSLPQTVVLFWGILYGSGVRERNQA